MNKDKKTNGEKVKGKQKVKPNTEPEKIDRVDLSKLAIIGDEVKGHILIAQKDCIENNVDITGFILYQLGLLFQGRTIQFMAQDGKGLYQLSVELVKNLEKQPEQTQETPENQGKEQEADNKKEDGNGAESVH
jgi:hypothetical protein